MKRKLLSAVLAVPLLICGTHPGYAAVPKQQPAKAALPAFPVFLNGTPVDNVHSLYPLLVYKDITYFPMTWNYSRALGLETSWDTQSGLSIDKQERAAKLTQDLTPQADDVADEAAVLPDFAIRINEKRIDNASEPYPLLVFRNVTYFPMTWRFTHDEFGWTTSWDSESGLRIDTAAASGGSAPVAASDDFNLQSGGQMATDGGWIYYNPNNSYDGPGYLYKMRPDGSGQQKLTDDNARSINVAGDWVYYTVLDRQNNLHQGIYKVRADGTGRTKISDAPAGRITVDGDWIYYVDQVMAGQEQYSVGYYKTLGIAKIKTDGTGETPLFQGTVYDPMRGAVADSLHVLKDWIVFVQPGDADHPDQLSKIRKDGTQLTPLAAGHFEEFLLADDWIYYVDNNELFKTSLEGSSAIPLRKFDEPVNFFSLHYHDGWLYYVKGMFGIMGSAAIEKIRTDGSEPTPVIGGVRATSLYFAGGRLYFAAARMGDAPLYEVTDDMQIKSLEER